MYTYIGRVQRYLKSNLSALSYPTSLVPGASIGVRQFLGGAGRMQTLVCTRNILRVRFAPEHQLKCRVRHAPPSAGDEADTQHAVFCGKK